MFDLSMYATVDGENIAAMHNVALQSEFGIPLIGNASRNTGGKTQSRPTKGKGSSPKK